MSKFVGEVAAGNLNSELAAWSKSDIGQGVDTGLLTTAGGVGGFLLGGPAGAIAGASLGLSIGSEIAGATDAATAADTQASQAAAADALKLKQAADDKTALEKRQGENLTQLTTNQAAELALLTKQQKETLGLATTKQTEDLATFGNQQALEEQRQSTEERAAYLSANYQLKGAQQQIGAQRAAAQGGGSTLIANAANRGIKVGEGAVKSAQDIAKGNITTNADGSVSYAAAAPNIYDPASSPLMQLAVYERSANKAIAAQGEATVGASNLATGEIASGTRQFMAQQGQNRAGFVQGQDQSMAAFELGQAQNVESLLSTQGMDLRATELAYAQGLESAQLGYNQMRDTILQDQAFTETNLETYKSSLWLSAFSNIVDAGTSVLGKLYTPKYKPAYVSSDYTDFGKDYGRWGSYRG